MDKKEFKKIEVATDCGVITVEAYDDEIANGVKIFLGDTIVAMVDCYKKTDNKDTPEARLLVYGPEGPDYDEPQDCIILN